MAKKHTTLVLKLSLITKMKSKNIIIAIFVIILLVFSYLLYSRRNTLSSSGDTVNKQTRATGQELVLSMNRIKTLQIDTDFFTSDSFMALRDSTPVIEVPQKIGRPNPFLPF